MTRIISIDTRYVGPPETGQGGYVAGLLSAGIDGAAQVTLKAATPVGTPLEIRNQGDGRYVLALNGSVFAEAAPTELDLEIPQPVSFDTAHRAHQGFHGWLRRLGIPHHPIATCFVCGTGLENRYYLNILPGPLDDGRAVACPWVPAPELANENGEVAREFVWSVLDCPAGWALMLDAPLANRLTGRLAAKQVAPIRAGERYVTLGWFEGADGRKLYGCSAIFDAGGGLCAYARATWINLVAN